MSECLIWERDGRDWPHRETSHFVQAGGLRWHVQQLGCGPVMLLIHGTGAATHSWRDLAPLLAQSFTLVSADLPAHAFTETPPARGLSLPGMAASMAALVDTLGLDVRWVLGHSAGAAIAARMILDRRIAPQALIGLNAAMLPLDGVAGLLFPPAARLMASTSIAARLFAWRASDPAAIERLIAGTGSVLSPAGVALYARLVRDVKHVAGALAMMAQWDLKSFAPQLRELGTPLALLAGDRDRAVPPTQTQQVLAMLPQSTRSTLTVLRGAGHLAHEERPAEVAQFVRQTVAWVNASGEGDSRR